MVPNRVIGTSRDDGLFTKYPKVDDPAFKVYFFPYSAGAATAGSQFFASLPPKTEVISFNSPSKVKNPQMFPTYSAFMDYVVPIMIADLAEHPKCRFALIGHSFGSLLVWLTLVYFRRLKHRMPDAVFIASKRSPLLHAVNGDAEMLKQTFAETKETYLKLHGKSLPPRILQEKALVDGIVRAFAIDMKVNLSFWMDLLTEEERKPFLDVECFLYWGDLDTVVNKDEMISWNELFPNAHPMKIFENTGHMLMGTNEKQKEILADVCDVIKRK